LAPSTRIDQGFEFDGAGRLVRESVVGGGHKAFNYDAAGNRTSELNDLRETSSNQQWIARTAFR